MDPQRRSLRIGAAVIVCAVVLRLIGSGKLQGAAEALEQRGVLSFLIYLETGRRLPGAAGEGSQASETAPPEAGEPAQTDPAPVFRASDADRLAVTYDEDCPYRPDLEKLLTAPLDWELTGDEPTVLILHTHTSESYTAAGGEDYEESSPYRTLDEAYNMLSIGDAVAELLIQGGVRVIHDRSFHDYPSYNGSYLDARESTQAYLERYPSIRLILDLHRDAAEDGAGDQMATHAVVDGRDGAQIMLVVGTDAGGLDHPGWQDNLSLALKLDAVLEARNPGVCRPVALRSERFNEDLSPGALLIEIGAAGNTHDEALITAQALAGAILSLAHGTTADSTS